MVIIIYAMTKPHRYLLYFNFKVSSDILRRTNNFHFSDTHNFIILPLNVIRGKFTPNF